MCPFTKLGIKITSAMTLREHIAVIKSKMQAKNNRLKVWNFPHICE